jgi:hypothetical protein
MSHFLLHLQAQGRNPVSWLQGEPDFTVSADARMRLWTNGSQTYRGTLPGGGNYCLVGLLPQNRIETLASALLSGTTNIQSLAPFGHFAGVVWNAADLYIFNDALGLRQCYYYLAEDLFVTSNPFWLRTQVDMEPDMAALGSTWLTFNQMSTRSIFRDVQRLDSGEVIQFSLGQKAVKRHSVSKFVFSETNISHIYFNNAVGRVLQEFAYPHLALSLSGGYDSRVMLGIIMNIPNLSWDSHTLGEKHSTDSRVVAQIAREFNIRNQHLNLPVPADSEFLARTRQFVADSLLTKPATEVLQLTNYEGLSNRNALVVDGGFGEIWRAGFLQRLEMFGETTVRNRDFAAMVKLTAAFKANIFNEDAIQMMQKGAETDFAEIFAENPPEAFGDLRDWYDFVALKTRLPNYYAPEQARMDHRFANLMPLAQPYLLQHLFAVPFYLRQQRRFLNDLLKTLQPVLTQIPLAKNDIIHYFYLTGMQTRVLTKIVRFLGMGHRSTIRDEAITRHKKVLINILRDHHYPELDRAKVKGLLNDLQTDNVRRYDELGWALTWILFRQSLKAD